MVNRRVKWRKWRASHGFAEVEAAARKKAIGKGRERAGISFVWQQISNIHRGGVKRPNFGRSRVVERLPVADIRLCE
jgi:hypothetical protein